MQLPKHRAQNLLFKSIIVLFCASLLSACSGRKAQTESSEDKPGMLTDSQRIESLSAALSRAQAKIEELDAKLTVLTEKSQAQTSLPVETIPAASHPTHAKEAKEIPSPPVIHETASQKSADDDAVSAFLNSMRLLKAGKYSEAQINFNRFTEAYPEHILAGSAQFYAGEAYYFMGEYKLAALEYQKVTTRFPHSPRASTALVRLTQCQQATGNADQAKQTWASAQFLYAGSPTLDIAATSSTASQAQMHAEPKTTQAAPAAEATTGDEHLPTKDLTAEPMMGSPETEHE